MKLYIVCYYDDPGFGDHFVPVLISDSGQIAQQTVDDLIKQQEVEKENENKRKEYLDKNLPETFTSEVYSMIYTRAKKLYPGHYNPKCYIIQEVEMNTILNF